MKWSHAYILILLIISFKGFGNDYNILSFGAIGNGKALNTIAIQSAIDEAHKNGGGRVIIPSGEFLTGSIILKSGVELFFKRKSVLLGSTEPKDYFKINRWKALILADSANNIKISGSGIINGQGAKLALHIDSLFYAGKIDSVDYNFIEKRPKYYLRPQLLEFVKCQNIEVTGVSFKNAACWVQTYDLCKDLLIDNIKVESDAYWNNDGIDIVDCKRVKIINCNINSADDGICLKSSIANNRIGSTYHGNNYCDSIYISNCTIRSSASAIKLGARSVGGFKNITINNIKIYDTFRSAIALECVDGGTMENIRIDGIRATNVGNAIFIRLGHRIRGRDYGSLQNISIKNIVAKISFEPSDKSYIIRGPSLPFFHNTFPASITGIEKQTAKNILLENIKIIYPGRGYKAYASMPISRLKDVPELETKYPEYSMFGELPAWGFYVRHIEGLIMKEIKIKIKKDDYRPAMVFDDVNKLDLKSIQISGDSKKNSIIYNKVENVSTEK